MADSCKRGYTRNIFMSVSSVHDRTTPNYSKEELLEMLRISELSNSNNEVVLKLEGKIVDLWVAELEKQCKKYINQTDLNLVLNFTDVSYISKEGITFLNRIKNKIKIINAQPYIELCLKNSGLKNQIN